MKGVLSSLDDPSHSNVLSRGIKLIYLPPYSPDFNPIEECFSFVKQYIHRNRNQFHAELQTGEDYRIFAFLQQALAQVTSEHAKGWFKHSGYL